jgi:hypothetical protein
MPFQQGGAIDRRVLAESHTSARPRASGWWCWIGLMAQPVPVLRSSQTSSRNPESWTRFRQGVRGACWYLSRLHSQLQQKLPNSRSVR